MQRARQLFAIAIETPGGLKVQTIHAFCERLLQRFPLEAGVPPGFAILDEHERGELLAEAADEMLAEATAAPGTPLADALETAVAYATDGNFDQLLCRGTCASRTGWPPPCGSTTTTARTASSRREKIYRRAIGLGPDVRMADLDEQLVALLSDAELRRLQGVLASGSANDIKACRAHRGRAAGGAGGPHRALCAASSSRRRRAAQEPADQGAGGRAPRRACAARRGAQVAFLALDAERRKVALLDAAIALIRLGSAVLQRYGEAKARCAALDFDDLVAKAASLLRSSAAVEWVLYKLDGGLDHILVDEAQDTSPVQWQVIRALAEEFFSGAGASEAVRTLFAVGDEKQSIYGFQGAAPTMFAATGEAFARPCRSGAAAVAARAAQPVVPRRRAAAGRGRPHLRRRRRARRA